ncbi:MAG: ATP-binding protein, partial [Rudaea sp.]
SVATFVFTDLEGSSRLWEKEPERMHPALAAHDRLARAAVEGRSGRVLKLTGDGLCAVFDDPLHAVEAALAFQNALADPARTGGLQLHARCGIHVGVAQKRDNDYFGNTVNRAARIMSAGNGGQVLLSQAVVDLVRGRLPDALSLRDLGSVRLRDLSQPERLYQLLHTTLRADFPALRSLEATPNNLPLQATSFVGRELELAEAGEALSRTRLLTLVGAGGIGKTRLSLQLAAEVLDDYPDGAWFVELAPIADERLVVQAVATTLGVKEDPGVALADVLVRWAADKRLLLLLDNCEHVLTACATLAGQLLRGAAGLRMLASSREPLRIPGEVTYPVPALRVPGPGGAHGDVAYADYASVRLFADRATAVLPTFRLTEGNGRTIGEICRHLDGIPLAIELAAARTRALPIDAIAARLGDRFRLLTGGSRTALPRQQTLRALIDWSHDLLADPERVLLRRLSVFAGGWTLDGAEAVCAGGEVERDDILELIAGLVDKSLAVADVGSGRYRLLETIRQYAGEKLGASGEAPAVIERYVEFCLGFAEEMQGKFHGAEQGSTLARVDIEHENLLSALAACAGLSDGGPKGLRLVNALKTYWFSRGQLPLGKRLTKEALDTPGARRRDRPRSVALFGLGQFCSFSGEYDEAIGYLEEGLAIARELGDKDRIAATLQPLAFAEFGRGRLDDARRHSEESLAIARAVGKPDQIAAALNAVAQMRRAQGDLAGAEPLYDEVVAVARELGDRELVAIGLLNLAMVYIARSAHRSARLALQEIIAIASETGSMPVGQSALEVAAGLAGVLGEHDLALRLYGAAEANTMRTGIVRDPADDAFLQPLIAAARDALGSARASEAERRGRDAGYEPALSEARAWITEAGARGATGAMS